MSLFNPKPRVKREKPPKQPKATSRGNALPPKKTTGGFGGGKKSTAFTVGAPTNGASIADLAMKMIREGIVVVDREHVIRYINPAAAEMTGIGAAADAVGIDVGAILKFEKLDGEKIEDQDNKIFQSINDNKAFESREYVLVSIYGDKKTPIAINVVPSGNPTTDRIVSFRNITKELEEEGAQSEFISTASHEMRTPVASIEGYLGLALNPQTATIDARARQYIESAHAASKRLGNLFKDLLDVTKLDDKRARLHLVPIELNGFVKKFADEYTIRFREKNLSYSFGADGSKKSKFGGGRVLSQVVYTLVDVDFLGEIISNLLENALKYTPNGGAIWVNVQGDGDRALINVTDTGIGIAAEDLQHIFQKFYRADNSQTRTIGGTGLGLYLVKQRVEAMDGRVWAESAFGEGSTFYVSLPRITGEEYERRKASARNRAAVEAFEEQAMRKDTAAEAATAKMNALEAEAQARAQIEEQKRAIAEQEALAARQQQAMVAPQAVITQAAQAPVAQPVQMVQIPVTPQIQTVAIPQTQPVVQAPVQTIVQTPVVATPIPTQVSEVTAAPAITAQPISATPTVQVTPVAQPPVTPSVQTPVAQSDSANPTPTPPTPTVFPGQDSLLSGGLGTSQ